MRKTAALLCAAVLLLATLSFATAEGKYVRITTRVSVKTEASFIAGQVRLAKTGECFELVGEDNVWYEIILEDGTHGFVQKDACTLTDSPDGSGAAGAAAVPIERIRLSETNQFLLPVDAIHRLTATVEPEGADAREIEWMSTNEQVARVDKKGNVIGVGRGTATIRATAKGNNRVRASVNVRVAEYDMVFYSAAPLSKTIHTSIWGEDIRVTQRTHTVSTRITGLGTSITNGETQYMTVYDIIPEAPGEDTITFRLGKANLVLNVFVMPEAFEGAANGNAGAAVRDTGSHSPFTAVALGSHYLETEAALEARGIKISVPVYQNGIGKSTVAAESLPAAAVEGIAPRSAEVYFAEDPTSEGHGWYCRAVCLFTVGKEDILNIKARLNEEFGEPEEDGIDGPSAAYRSCTWKSGDVTIRLSVWAINNAKLEYEIDTSDLKPGH